LMMVSMWSSPGMTRSHYFNYYCQSFFRHLPMTLVKVGIKTLDHRAVEHCYS
jgi:hypothetical protein